MFDELHIKMHHNNLSSYLNRVLYAVMHGDSVMVIVGVDKNAVLAVVNECCRHLVHQAMRVVRLRMSPDAPLTLKDIIQELVPVDQSMLPVEDDELIVYMLARHQRRQEATLLIIERAEHLPLQTLIFLQMLVTGCSASIPQIQIIFTGDPKFLELVQRDELGDMRDRLGTVVQIAASSAGTALSTMPLAFLQKIQRICRMQIYDDGVSRIVIVGIAVVILLCGGFITRTLYQHLDDVAYAVEGATIATGDVRAGLADSAAIHESLSDLSEPKALMVPRQLSSVATSRGVNPVTPLPAEGHEPDPTAPSDLHERHDWPAGEQLTRLRRDFEQFLAQTERGPKRHSNVERSRLFNEFLQWSYGVSNSGPTPGLRSATVPLPSSARVTMYSLAGSANGTRVARQLMQKLEPSMTHIRARAVRNVPGIFELRCFTQEDKLAADMFAQWLQDSDIMWTVRVMPDSRQRSTLHTFELWIPLQ